MVVCTELLGVVSEDEITWPLLSKSAIVTSLLNSLMYTYCVASTSTVSWYRGWRSWYVKFSKYHPTLLVATSSKLERPTDNARLYCQDCLVKQQENYTPIKSNWNRKSPSPMIVRRSINWLNYSYQNLYVPAVCLRSFSHMVRTSKAVNRSCNSFSTHHPCPR